MILIPALKDLTGQKFGKWTVIKRMENYITPSGNTFTQWLCRCDCNSEPRGVLTNALTSGRSTSCGCYQKETAKSLCSELFTTHKESKTRLYKIWAGMKKRCQNKNSSNYQNYGGRGISVCKEWNQYESFRNWALTSGYSDDLSIDRIDVNGNYSPENCRWVTRIAQANNRRSNILYQIGNETHSLAEWARLYNLDYKQLHKAIKHNNASLNAYITN